MTDVNFKNQSAPVSSPNEKVRVGNPPEELNELPYDLIELLFFAYRDFTSDPDDVLAQYEFGRAHHRVLHFVDRNPGIKVTDLLNILRITKQSLGRVLKQLVDQDFIEQRPGPWIVASDFCSPPEKDTTWRCSSRACRPNALSVPQRTCQMAPPTLCGSFCFR